MAATIPDEFDSDVGQLSDYTTILGGFPSHLNSAGAQVDATPPTNDTDRLTPMLANRHVDVRSFITTDPDHGRPMSQMDLLHMMENAYHQSVNSVGDAITGGTWKLTWEDTGPIEYDLTTDYTSAHADSTHQTITRVALGHIASGEVVHVSYRTSVGTYVNESVTMTGTTAQHLAHEADNVVADSIIVSRATNVLTSVAIDYNATAAVVKAAIEGFVPQIIDSLAFDVSRPAVTVTGSAFPYIITLQDETQPPAVREIGSWAPLFGVVFSSLTSGGTATLDVTNLRTDEDWLKSASTAHLTMSEVETVTGSLNENWLTTGTGLTSFTVGKDSTHNNWRSGKAIFSGAALAAKFISRTPLAPVNILGLNADRSLTTISLIMPDYASVSANLVLANCKIQFTSDPNGLFADESGTGADSTNVPFTGHITGVRFTTALTTFGTGCDWSRITAVRISLGGTPSAAQHLTFMALRATDDNWVATELDTNTRTGRLESPVSLTGAAGDTGLAAVSPLIRSVNEYGATSNDPAPNAAIDPSLTDGTLSVKFNSGAQVAVVGSEPTNTIILYLRQRVNADATWDWIQAQLTWGTIAGPSTVAFFGVAKASSDGTATTFTDDQVIDGFSLASSTEHLFTADLSDDILTLRVSTIDSNGVTDDVFVSDPIETTDFERIRGRVGWYAEFPTDKDADIDYVRSSNVSFATLRTAIFHSRTPIDGAQLSVAASGPSQMWESFELVNPTEDVTTDDVLELDPVKKLSTSSSYRFTGGGLNTYSGIQSNIVDFDDWREMFLDFDVWMPSTLSQHNSVQQVTIDGSPSSGTFKLTHDGAETSAIPWNATAAQVQTALGALGTIGVGNVLCTLGPLGSGGFVVIRFVNGLAGADVSTLIVSNNSVTGGTPVVTQVGVRPQIFLKEPGTELDYTVGTIGPFNISFVPGAWSHVHLDLSILSAQAIGSYRVQILTQQPSSQIFWVDNMLVGHRSIAWELRAIENGTWYPFLESVNDPRGALHLPHSARGTAIQLQARALRDEAWISSYTLKPHYAELGRLIGNEPPTLDDGGSIPKVIGVVSGVDIYTPA